jgi:hypothetical protein
MKPKRVAHTDKGKVRITNGALLNLLANKTQESFALFFENPLPVLARIDLKVALDAIFKRLTIVNEAHIALLKKHGAVEKEGQYTISLKSPGWEAYKREFETFAAAEFELPVGKVSIPARVMVGGKQQDIVATDPAASILEQMVAWERCG